MLSFRRFSLLFLLTAPVWTPIDSTALSSVFAQSVDLKSEALDSFLDDASDFDAREKQYDSSSAISSGDSVLTSRTYYDGAETIGRVGREAILRRDVVHQIKKFAHMQFLTEIEKLPEEERETKRKEYQEGILQAYLNNEQIYAQILDNHIRKLLFYNDYIVSRPKDQVEEQTKQLEKEFFSKMVPELKKSFHCETQKELEDYFCNEIQSDFEQEKRIFMQHTLGELWMNYNLGEEDFNPTAVDLRRYYEANLDEYRVKPRVRWQAMTVFYGRNRSKDEALRKMAHMGNAVRKESDLVRQEKLFAEVCRVDSEDVFAKNGGVRDWTEPGSLRSEAVESALFSDGLPVGALSKIIDDSNCLTIVRVVERIPARVKSFCEVQEEVRKKLVDDRKLAMQKSYEERLSARFSIEIYAISPEERREWTRTASSGETSATGRKVY